MLSISEHRDMNLQKTCISKHRFIIIKSFQLQEIFTIEYYDQNRNERFPFENKWFLLLVKAIIKLSY